MNTCMNVKSNGYKTIINSDESAFVTAVTLFDIWMTRTPPQIPDDRSHNGPCWSSHSREGNTGSARMGSSLDTFLQTQTNSKLTLLPPYVIIFSAWVVVGLCYCLLDRPLDRPSVQQPFLPP